MNPKKSIHHFKAAFTLTEILVVITIIAVLATLLFSLTSRMRNKASSAISVSNLRQIGMAITTYASDNNGTLPGPTYAHLRPKYGATTNVLLWHLRDYLPYVNQPQNPTADKRYCPTWDYPAAKSDGQNPLSPGKPTYTYSGATDAIGPFWPLGYPGINPVRPPMTTTQLSARETRGKPLISESPLINPPPHGKYRNTLMLDFSVQAIPAK